MAAGRAPAPRPGGDPAAGVAVVLDTSALLLPFQHGIDVERELDRLLPGHTTFVPRPVADELRLLAEKGSGAAQRHAKAALGYLGRFLLVEAAGRGDDAVVNAVRGLAAAHAHAVAVTTDGALRKRIRSLGHPVVHLRGRTLALDGWVS